ncbi:MAG: amino acid deaminase [Microbacteriaceae bacterium]|nr:MAG: amino acid deaminase [Microbacteriaceae bacterium]
MNPSSPIPAPLPTALEAAEIARCVVADARAGRLASWGWSTVVDEFVGEAVVPEGVVTALHRLAGLRARFPLGNAGLLHVYGYWFATRATPFGYKRDRWLDGRLARAFGLPDAAFIPGADPATTPLQRVLEVALPLLADPRDALASADASVDGRLTRVVLARDQGSAATALVYGVDGGDGLRLVTTFPVDGDGDVGAVLDEFVAEPRLRWNAVAVAET